MAKRKLFYGIATALITPFQGGEIDYAALKKIIDIQIDAGINALVIGGTTGEISTITPTERERLYSFACEYISGRVPVILGTGSNNTALAIELGILAKRAGADGALVVTPYYNKGTKEGIKNHYLKIANEVDLPIILYNVPGRTTVNLEINLLHELSKCDKIVGIKEASDSAERLCEIAQLGDTLPLYSGNDSQTFSTLALGGGGTISVMSNLFPSLMLKIVDNYTAGDIGGARDIQLGIMGMIKALFAAVNPSPIKYAMSIAGHCTDEVRLPLSLPPSTLREKISEEYKNLCDIYKIK